jgi:adenosylmethionine-8-amino-7-oxononanoate aminotransferase
VKKNFIDQRFAQMFFSIGLEKGLLIRPIGNTVYVMPPYILNEEQTQFLGATVQSTLEATLAS